jgi:putative intracellular protease/amidase
MSKRLALFAAFGVAAVLTACGAAWVLSLPRATSSAPGPLIAQNEIDSILAALKPPKRQRPLVAVLGVNEGTELTDYLMPYGILRRADVADVIALATKPGAVRLFPALQVEAQASVDEFDAAHPEGADYVIVPAMHRDDDPVALGWVKGQAAKGAMIVGVCAGAKVVAEAGLLEGKRATTHWYYVEQLQRRHPSIQYVPHRRLVVDRGVVTTTGISASMPMSLILIEAIAGRDKAESVARSLGLSEWDARHNSDAFLFSRDFALTVMGNTAAFWNRERLGIELQPDVDEVSLALVADTWSRTYRSRAMTFAAGGAALRTRGGIAVIPDEVAAGWPDARRLPAVMDQPPARALDNALEAIGDRYGRRTAEVVAMQLEYRM